MKTKLSSIVLISSLATLIGCAAKEKSVTLDVSTGFALTSAGFTGGLVVSGKNSAKPDQRFVKTVFGGKSVNITLPDGKWELSVVGWDGAAPSATQAPFTGDVYCGKTPITFGSSDLKATVTVSKENCLGTDFSGEPYYDATNTPNTIHPLRIVTCGSFYNYSSSTSTGTPTRITLENSNTIASNFCESATHPLDLRSRTKSIKIVPLNKDLNTNFTGSASSNPYCQATNSQLPGIFLLEQQIPASNLPLQIELYADGFCQKPINRLLFPDGIAMGNSSFDSIFSHKGIEATLGPSITNRLIIPDNDLGKGYSPLIALMPEIKCGNGFCGDEHVKRIEQTTDGTTGNTIPVEKPFYDYFIEIKYLNPTMGGDFYPEPTVISIPSTTTLCPAQANSANKITIHNCEYQNNMTKVTVTPNKSCPDYKGDICHSPRDRIDDFSFTLSDGITRTIYFKGEKDSGTATALHFSHFPQALNLNDVNCDGTVIQLTYPTPPYTYLLNPLCMNQNLYVSPFYSGEKSTYEVSDQIADAYSIKFNYQSLNPNYSTVTTSFFLLPPDQREQKDILMTIARTLGSDQIKKTFGYFQNGSYHGDDKSHPNSEKYGSLRRIREMFSPNGPAALFEPNKTCNTLNETKTITLFEDGKENTIEVSITNTKANTLHAMRPRGFCIGSNPLASQAACNGTNSINFGRYQKSMTIKKNGKFESVMLFDCDQKAGRYESLHVEEYDGKHHREKELIFWNTEDSNKARYEGYSINMESSDKNFESLKNQNYEIEKIFKKTKLVEVGTNSTEMTFAEGNVVQYRINPVENPDGTTSPKQNVSFTRYDLNTETGMMSYANYNFNEPYLNTTVNQFFSSEAEAENNKYHSYTMSNLDEPHFCTAYNFPFNYLTQCPSNAFAHWNEAHPLALSFPGLTDNENFQGLTMRYVEPTKLEYALNQGYFNNGWENPSE